jgi:hypothetical protein
MSEIDETLTKRIDSARRYFDFLAVTQESSWIEIYEMVDGNEGFGFPETLVLLEPRHYEELKVPDPRGPRSFAGTTIYSKCRSRDIWGYECPFGEQTIHVDHLFPQSRGGMTHQTNALYLCEVHNSAKFTDIHLIPWEKMVVQNEWVSLMLGKLIDAASRLHKKKLYFPNRQLSKL